MILPWRCGFRVETEAEFSPTGMSVAIGKGAMTGAAQTLPQAIAFMALSPGWSGQPWQSPWLCIAMAGIAAI